MKDRSARQENNQNGNVLFYILIAVALVGALTYVMSRGAGDSGTGAVATRISEDIKAQAQTIRAAVLECVLVHNYGYPAEPGSGLVADLECQVDDVPNYVEIFSGATGRFLPQPPGPFTGWTYTVDTGTTPDSIYIELSHAMDCTGDMGVRSALSILQTQFTADETNGTVCNGTEATFRLNLVVGS